MKVFLSAVLAASLTLTGCSGPSAAVLIASLGIAGSGLSVYCASQGIACDPAVTAFSTAIINEAVADAVVWESGSTTAEKIAATVANLNADLAAGRLLVGLSPQGQAEVTAAITTIQALIPLFEALSAKNPVPVASVAPRAAKPVILPKLSTGDRAKLDAMLRKVGR